MQIFYSKEITDKECFLDSEESRHCINVLRHKPGDSITIFDGKGKIFTGNIADDNRKRCKIDIISYVTAPARPYYLHIAIAPTKNIGRYEWFAEKATEIGVDEITPIICARSERNIIKNERTEKIVVSAMKQSMNPYIPVINKAVPINELLSIDFRGTKCIAHCVDRQKDSPDRVIADARILLLIGPEGDFTETEIDNALKSGFKPVTLGPNRLRTETAGVYACAVIQNQFSLKL